MKTRTLLVYMGLLLGIALLEVAIREEPKHELLEDIKNLEIDIPEKDRYIFSIDWHTGEVVYMDEMDSIVNDILRQPDDGNISYFPDQFVQIINRDEQTGIPRNIRIDGKTFYARKNINDTWVLTPKHENK